MAGDSTKENLLLGIGNPLLDISAVVDKAFLEKYELQENDAILADEKHKNLYKELTEKYEASYIAGGSVQNTLRVAQWLLKTPKLTTFFGCVGKDNYSKILYDIATSAGVNVQYQYNETVPTGTCAVLITGHHRSLVTTLDSANCFTIDHLQVEANKKIVDTAKFYYVSGYFLTVNAPAQMQIAETALAKNSPFIMNLSAPFICQFYTQALQDALPYIDVLFGNESEAETFAASLNLGTKDVEEIAISLSALPKKNEARKRLVIITQGTDPVIVVTEGKVTKFPVEKLPKDKIVDTNGAGDAFAGGFLSQYILGKSLEACVKCGNWAARQIIQRSGCTFEGNPDFHIE